MDVLEEFVKFCSELDGEVIDELREKDFESVTCRFPNRRHFFIDRDMESSSLAILGSKDTKRASFRYSGPGKVVVDADGVDMRYSEGDLGGLQAGGYCGSIQLRIYRGSEAPVIMVTFGRAKRL